MFICVRHLFVGNSTNVMSSILVISMITLEYQVRTNCTYEQKSAISSLYSRTKVSYRLQEWRRLEMLLCVSISFTGVVFLTLFFSIVRLSFPFSSQLTLDSHSIRPSRSVVTALRLYKFYIIFMRHKVVEKATADRRERVKVWARRCAKGKFRRSNHPSRFCATPASRVVVTWLGGADCIPSCSLGKDTKKGVKQWCGRG